MVIKTVEFPLIISTSLCGDTDMVNVSFSSFKSSPTTVKLVHEVLPTIAFDGKEIVSGHGFCGAKSSLAGMVKA